ncbi:phospholipid scramblase 1-like isoform X2 [Convolutriloba macropyga]|uniref:phospholipid scramblase 1-like isoform X2 n=1 Tax=Convolutriloba macropyga TaxID=536237 RepID=UPI003F51FB3D
MLNELNEEGFWSIYFEATPLLAMDDGKEDNLHLLIALEQICMHRSVDGRQAVSDDWGRRNSYSLKDVQGQHLYDAREESDSCERGCCGPHRGFIIHIADTIGQAVFHVSRDFVCGRDAHWACCTCCCCPQEIEVRSSADGHTIGVLKLVDGRGEAAILVCEANGTCIFSISIPCCVCRGTAIGDREFPIMTESTGEIVGTISKQYSGLVHETFTDAENFILIFPIDLDVKLKAALIATDFMYFENDNRN